MNILRELIDSLSRVVDRYLDEIELSILKIYAFYGNISLYKASNLSGFAVSTTYKKAKKLLELGFLKSDTSHTHKITVKGLLQCIVQDVDNAPYFINKIRLIWRINAKFEELCSYLILLSHALKIQGLKLSELGEIDDFKQTARYIFPPIMRVILREENNVDSLSKVIAQVLGVKQEVVTLCENLIIRAFNEFFTIFTLRVLSILAGIKTGAVLLVYDGKTTVEVYDLCNLDLDLIKLKVRRFLDKVRVCLDNT